MKSAIENYNPIVPFVSFTASIVCAVCFIHPLFQGAALLLSLSTALTVQGREALKYAALMLPAALLIALINPLFTDYGTRVIGTVFGSPYTVESLVYGAGTGVMFMTVMLWFMSFNRVMTADRLMYLFGKLMPAFTLLLSMILRFVPGIKKRLEAADMARGLIGKGTSSGSRREKLRHGAMNLGAVTAFSLEKGIITADSMKARGYGSGRRTFYADYRVTGRDKAALAVDAVCIAAVIILSVRGGSAYDYAKMSYEGGAATVWELAAYAILMAVPAFINIREAIRWRRSISRT